MQTQINEKTCRMCDEIVPTVLRKRKDGKIASAIRTSLPITFSSTLQLSNVGFDQAQ